MWTQKNIHLQSPKEDARESAFTFQIFFIPNPAQETWSSEDFLQHLDKVLDLE